MNDNWNYVAFWISVVVVVIALSISMANMKESQEVTRRIEVQCK